ncbi:hypothetical protein C8J57DRAFT_1244996 [Mycena rebaudengoi]|nr:hypothetical protein C8J57DRAFT_1244996 [Mycena rebaudengoi]
MTRSEENTDLKGPLGMVGSAGTTLKIVGEPLTMTSPARRGSAPVVEPLMYRKGSSDRIGNINLELSDAQFNLKCIWNTRAFKGIDMRKNAEEFGASLLYRQLRPPTNTVEVAVVVAISVDDAAVRIVVTRPSTKYDARGDEWKRVGAGDAKMWGRGSALMRTSVRPYLERRAFSTGMQRPANGGETAVRTSRTLPQGQNLPEFAMRPLSSTLPQFQT